MFKGKLSGTHRTARMFGMIMGKKIAALLAIGFLFLALAPRAPACNREVSLRLSASGYNKTRFVERILDVSKPGWRSLRHQHRFILKMNLATWLTGLRPGCTITSRSGKVTMVASKPNRRDILVIIRRR